MAGGHVLALGQDALASCGRTQHAESAAIFTAGAAYAIRLRRHCPAVYARLATTDVDAEDLDAAVPSPQPDPRPGPQPGAGPDLQPSTSRA